MKSLINNFFFLICISLSDINSQTTLDWVKQIKSTNYGTVAYGIGTDLQGNVYTAGYLTGSADFDPGPGTFTLSETGYPLTDVYIQKLNSNGEFIWAKRIGSNNWDRLAGFTVDQLGNVYGTGQFGNTVDFDPGPGQFNLTSKGGEAFVFKLNSDGDFQWATQFKALGGDDKGKAIKTDANGDVIVLGYFSDTTDFDPGPGTYTLVSRGLWDAFVTKLSSTGSFIWAKSIGSKKYESPADVAVDEDGNITFSGMFSDTVDFNPGNGIYNLTAGGGSICQWNSSGDFNWARQVPLSSSEGGHLAIDSRKDIFITGDFWFTSDFNPGSNSFTMASVGDEDAFVMKLDQQGNFKWAKSFGGPKGDSGFDIDVDADGNVFVLGFSDGDTIDFDPGIGTWFLDCPGHGFVCNLNSSGGFVDAVTYGKKGYVRSYAIQSHGRSIYITGYFQVNPDFDPGPDTLQLFCLGNADAFTLKLNKAFSTVDLREIKRLDNFAVYPNPSHGIFKVDIPHDESNPLILTITDVLGRTVFRQLLKSEGKLPYEIDITSLTPGAYILTQESDTHIGTAKIIYSY